MQKSSKQSIESRLDQIEYQIEELQRQQQVSKNWFDAIRGSFKGDPEFAEILRLGREIRQSDRPK